MPEQETTGEKQRRARGRPKSDEVARIENDLLDVAFKEFVNHGYGGTSMRRIVKAAGTSRTTIAARYASKEELFRAIMHQQIERQAPVTTLTSANEPTSIEQGLKDYANHMLEISLEGDLLAVNRLIYSESQRFPELGSAAAERTQLGIVQIAQFIRRCAELDGIACRDAESVAEAFIMMLRGWYVNVMLASQAGAPAERKAWVDKAVHVFLSARANW